MAMQRLLISLLSISLFLCIFLGSASSLLFDQGFYHKEYEKNKVYEKLGSNITWAATNNLFNYFHSEEELNYFSMEERAHLQDVKNLIVAGYAIYAVAIVSVVFLVLYLVMQKRKKIPINNTLFYSLLFAGGGALALLGIVFLLSATGFDNFFIGFHKLFFPAGNWQFPDYYPLIVMYPQQFWIDISLAIAARIAIFGCIALGVGFVGVRKEKQKDSRRDKASSTRTVAKKSKEK